MASDAKIARREKWMTRKRAQLLAVVPEAEQALSSFVAGLKHGDPWRKMWRSQLDALVCAYCASAGLPVPASRTKARALGVWMGGFVIVREALALRKVTEARPDQVPV